MNVPFKDIDEQVWTWGDNTSDYENHHQKNIRFTQAYKSAKHNMMCRGNELFIIHKSGNRISFKEVTRMLKISKL